MTRKQSDEWAKEHYKKIEETLLRELGPQRKDQISSIIHHALIKAINARIDKAIDPMFGYETEDLYELYKYIEPKEIRVQAPSTKKKTIRG